MQAIGCEHRNKEATMDKEQIIKVLLLARVALETSEPSAKHYPEPVARHQEATKQVKDLAEALLAESQG
jgi:hypothetical protein